MPITSAERYHSRIRPTFIICDIEGRELELFRSVCLCSVSKIVTDIHDDLIGSEGEKEIKDSLRERLMTVP